MAEYKPYNMQNYHNSLDKYKEFFSKLNSVMLPIVERFRPLSDVLNEFKLSLPDYSELLAPLKDVVKQISEIVETQLKNPNSALSYYQYVEFLTNLFWILPYGLSTTEIKEIIKQDCSEEQFDAFMIKHFNEDVLAGLFGEIESNLQEKHRSLFRQCVKAFEDESYALCSLGLYSVIDDLASFYLTDKGCSKRIGIFQPIIEELDNEDLFYENKELFFVLLMMDRCLNELYENISFNVAIRISRHKNTNRHVSMHGKQYTNEKSSDLMLFNIIYWLLFLQRHLVNYKDRLQFIHKTKIFTIK